MTTRSISNQVETIKSATEKASSSKEEAVAFLRQAGIIGRSGARVANAEPVHNEGYRVAAKKASLKKRDARK